jgi:hypothetical protein
MSRDVKEVVGLVMSVLNGGEVTHRELDDLAFEADGELETARNFELLRFVSGLRCALSVRERDSPCFV